MNLIPGETKGWIWHDHALEDYPMSIGIQRAQRSPVKWPAQSVPKYVEVWQECRAPPVLTAFKTPASIATCQWPWGIRIGRSPTLLGPNPFRVEAVWGADLA